ncbi:GNAT family N-acetyltransferase [Psychroflexus aestuariivivens]|uniref:GNAT family N-acetyltransferase n=1 Tax=Psychroflexus aestuariivivens TaxID=1795040 RepID=UPI000FD6D0ED|nr:GNAT family N-acetyltransferase [Psychroflexus aestuariivivens]
MTTRIRSFQELSTREIYDILQLRSEVFVVEQDCVYQDIDGHDEAAFHLTFYEGKVLAAYSRILPANAYFDELSIGRVIVKSSFRSQKLGHKLMKESIDFAQKKYPNQDIVISAQQYLIKFYESHAFKIEGEGYLEDDIPHIKMRLKY